MALCASHIFLPVAVPLNRHQEGCRDTSDPGHFGPKTFWQHPAGVEVSHGHFGTDTELSRRPANIFFATVGRTEERYNITRYYY